MNDIAAFVAACFTTPALLTSACALVIVPSLAWLAARALTPALRGMGDDPAWQAALAAAAAVVPGALFIIIGIATLREGWNSGCLQYATGRALYATIGTATAFGILRASWLAARRSGDVRGLIARSQPPRARVRLAGDAAGVRIRELSAAGSVLLVAGALRPVVLVSADAADRIGDAELLAAVRHEAAHARRGDLICAAVVTFVSELVPFPVDSFLAIFRRAREFAADAQAARASDPNDLASALLTLARPAHAHVSAAAFAEAGTVRARLDVLLATTPRRPCVVRRALVTAGFASTFTLGATPVLTALALGFTCSMDALR